MALSRMETIGRLIGCLAGLAGWCVAAYGAPPVSFDSDIRPILSDNCFHCHGPDGETRQADLRLDTHDGMTEHVVVPGKPAESELIRRVMSDDESERMPPPETGLRLSDEQKDLLRRWITEGAVFAEHWSFLPLPANVEVPPVADAAWPQQSLDYFVLARLETEGVRPSPPADPLRLLRRATLDITGLPPTAEDVRQFQDAVANDGLDAALEQAVDRLLSSDAYGEHLAVAWLDAARYADSFGYQSDQLNTQWPYRDWVVQALNDNLPYDKFITWQLAGDLLENPSRDQILATAYNRVHRMTNEGGSIAEEWRVENTADRVHTMGTALLGLTLECARCHDHKYDPITQRDYYSLFAFFNSIDENGMYDHSKKAPSPSLLLPTEEQAARLSAARQEVEAAQRALSDAVSQGEQRFCKWAESVTRTSADAAITAAGKDLIGHFTFDGELDKIPNQVAGADNAGQSSGLQSVEGVRGRAVQFDGDHGVEFPDFFQIDRWNSFTLDVWVHDKARSQLPAVVLQRTYGTDVGYNGFDTMLTDGIIELRFYRVWPGNGIGVRAREPIAHGRWQHLAVTYDGSSTARGLRLFVNGQEVPTEVLRDRMHKSASIATYGKGYLTLGQRFRDRGFRDGQVDDLRVYDRALTPLEVRNLHDGQSLEEALTASQSHRQALRPFYFSAVDPEARRLAEQLREARRRYVAEEDDVHEVSVMEELPELRPTHILARGAYDAPKTDENRVQRDTFSDILIPLPSDAPRNRLGLAQWMTDPRHPLTSRVFVNRLWANFFGRGLVTTPENFGRQGSMPTHPALLDWLARDFVDHGWDIKRLCRQIVLSATYRQRSGCRPELQERDPENRLLARGPSHRLSAEQIRDVALAASGLLVRKVGGPPVSPYQPGNDLWREANSMSPPYRQSTGKGLYRRSVYSVWKRTAPLPNMMAFDASTREICTVSRSRTNTPLQALVLLNDVQFVETARSLAEDVAENHVDTHAQIQAAFLRLTGRPPDKVESELLIDLYREQQAVFAESGQHDAKQYIAVGESESESPMTPADLAALTATCQAILNLDATVFKR